MSSCIDTAALLQLPRKRIRGRASVSLFTMPFDAPTLSPGEDSDLPVNEQGIRAVVAPPGRMPFPAASDRDDDMDEDERAAYRERLLQADARENAQDVMIDKFVAWFRDSVDHGREIKPMQQYRKLASVRAFACVPYAGVCYYTNGYVFAGLGKE